ncbi:uncharacterized protein [Misgurnus anguillicaudatus]|uniref:uncharacterized protein isoform X3 n=1 Tax=Misgurnus anguillicaudatus TaxID=75329 RepID=UPI003CCFC4CD
MYLIVEFIEEGTTGPIAQPWISDGLAWWPPYKDLDRLLRSVRTMETPQPEKGWTKHQARILYESASFESIAKKWTKACYTSDINSEPETPSGKRIPKKKIYSSDEEEDFPLKKKKKIKALPAQSLKVPPAPTAPPAPLKAPAAPPKAPLKALPKAPAAPPKAPPAPKHIIAPPKAPAAPPKAPAAPPKAPAAPPKAPAAPPKAPAAPPKAPAAPPKAPAAPPKAPAAPPKAPAAPPKAPAAPPKAPAAPPKAPAAPKHIIGPVVQPLPSSSSRTGNSFSNSLDFIPTNLYEADQPENAWGEHTYNQENTISVPRPSGFQEDTTQCGPGFIQQDEQGHAWSAYPLGNQEITYSELRPFQDLRGTYEERTPTPAVPVSFYQRDDVWGEHPSNFQENTTSDQRPSTHQGHTNRTHSACSMRQACRWSSVSEQCTPVERAILVAIGELEFKINHLTSVVQSLAGNRQLIAPMSMESEENVFPLTSMEELDRLEEQLSEREVMEKMVNKLSVRGGHTMKKTIWRICSKVFGPVLATQLNWCGRGDKRGIRQTRIKELLIAAAMRNTGLPSPTEAEAEKSIKDFLRLAPSRMSS